MSGNWKWRFLVENNTSTLIDLCFEGNYQAQNNTTEQRAKTFRLPLAWWSSQPTEGREEQASEGTEAEGTAAAEGLAI